MSWAQPLIGRYQKDRTGTHQFETLSQIELISRSASAIIVVLDDDKAIDVMERKIIEIFGAEKIIVLAPGAGSEAGSDSDSDEERSSIKMNTLKCLTYNLHRKQDTFNQVRSFLHERLDSGIGLVLSSSLDVSDVM